MYILVNTDDSKNQTFLTLEDLAKWVREQSPEPELKDTVVKVPAHILDLLRDIHMRIGEELTGQTSKEETVAMFLKPISTNVDPIKKNPVAIRPEDLLPKEYVSTCTVLLNEGSEDDEENFLPHCKTQLEEVFSGARLIPPVIQERTNEMSEEIQKRCISDMWGVPSKEHEKMINTVRSWFLSTFCDELSDVTHLLKYNTQTDLCWNLFSRHYKFCCTDPKMIRQPVELPVEIESFMKLCVETNKDISLMNRINTVINTKCYKIKPLCFIDFMKFIQYVERNPCIKEEHYIEGRNNHTLALGTYRKYIDKKLTGDMTIQWIQHIISNTIVKDKKGTIKSSVLDASIRTELSNQFMAVPYIQEIIMGFYTVQMLSKTMYTLGHDKVRRGAGYFYTGVSQRGSQAPSQHCDLSAVEGFNMGVTSYAPC